MASSRILSNLALDKLQINRLDAQAIRSDNIKSLSISFLYSLDFIGTFDRTPEGGVLTINENDVKSIIKFSDRPFRKTDTIDFRYFLHLFVVRNGIDTFSQDPPNGVLVHNEEQRSYIINLESFSSTTNEAKFNLTLLPGEYHNLSTVQGNMSFFVDNSSDNSTDSQLKLYYKGNLIDGYFELYAHASQDFSYSTPPNNYALYTYKTSNGEYIPGQTKVVVIYDLINNYYATFDYDRKIKVNDAIINIKDMNTYLYKTANGQPPTDLGLFPTQFWPIMIDATSYYSSN